MTDKGIRIVMLTGNHDMWVGKYLTEECGIELYTTPQLFELCGKQFYISHGDNTNIKGQPMLRLMNAFFRSKPLRFIASWIIHPDLFLKFGQWWSGSSRKAHKEQTELSYLDPLIEYARGYKETKIDHFIFGHLHIPHQTENITFLGNWATGASWAELDNDGNITLKHK
jgi:UDP-2,3-diacylglucosamine hydrolase